MIQWKKMKLSTMMPRIMATIGTGGMMVSQLKHKNGATMILTAKSGDRMGDRIILSPRSVTF